MMNYKKKLEELATIRTDLSNFILLNILADSVCLGVIYKDHIELYQLYISLCQWPNSLSIKVNLT